VQAAFVYRGIDMKKFLFAAAALAVAGAMPASALTLTGLTLTTGHQFPTPGVYDDGGPFDFTVGTSSPVSYFGLADSSIGASQYFVNVYCGSGCSWVGAPANTFVMSDTYGVAPTFTSVAINAATNYVGFDLTRLSFDADNVYVNLNGLDANGTIVIDISGGAVPEPASWALMVAGFGMIGGALRRRQAVLSA
jgi:hypothetical protein